MIKWVSKDKKGFSIIELMVAMIISSIFVITIGTMLYFSFSNWRKSRVAAELQQDAIFATDMLSRAIRPSSFSGITVSGSTLTIGNKSFYLSGKNLIYDPDTAVSGNEATIISGSRVASLSFQADAVSRTVSTSMTLQQGQQSASVNFIEGCRN